MAVWVLGGGQVATETSRDSDERIMQPAESQQRNDRGRYRLSLIQNQIRCSLPKKCIYYKLHVSHVGVWCA